MIHWLFYAVVSLLPPSDFPAAMSKLTAASRRVRQGKAFSFLFFGGSYPRVSRGLPFSDYELWSLFFSLLHVSIGNFLDFWINPNIH